MDTLLRERVEGGTRTLTIMLLVATVVLAIGTTYAIRLIEW